MCDQKIGASYQPLNLTETEISILKILRNLQTETGTCVENELRTETGRGQSSTCFQFCKHCLAQLDSVIAANLISTALPLTVSQVIQNLSLTSTGICEDHEDHNYNYNLSSSDDSSGPSSGSIPSQECTESNNKLSLFLKRVSAVLSSNSLTEVDTTTNNASVHTHGTDDNNYPVCSAAVPTPTAQLVAQQIGQETIFYSTPPYVDNGTAAYVEIEAGSQLPFATSTSTSSQPEAVLHHQYTPYNNTSTYTFEALVPQPRSFIFRNNQHGTETVTATAPDTGNGTGTGSGLGNFQFLVPVSVSAPGRDPGLIPSYQPNLIFTLEQSRFENILENVDERHSNQNESSYIAGLPFMGQEVERSSFGQKASTPQYQLPPLSVENVVQKRIRPIKQKLTSSVEQPPKTMINVTPGSVSVNAKKEGQCKRDKKPKKSMTISQVVREKLPQNNTHSCKSCTSTFPSRYALDHHRKEKHKVAACPCGQRYRQEKELREHKLVCAFLKTKKLYSCSICSKDYSSREGVKRHEKTHLGIKPHKCDKCDISFYERYELNKHLKTCACRNLCVDSISGRDQANSTSRVDNDAVPGTGTVVDPTSTATMEMVVPPSEAALAQSSSMNYELENSDGVKLLGTSTST